MNALDFHLPWFAEASLRVSVVLVVFLVARPWLRRFVGSMWVSALWLIIVARLLVPWPVGSPIGVSSFAGKEEPIDAPIVKYEVRTRVLDANDLANSIGAPIVVAKSPRHLLLAVWLGGVALGLALLVVRGAQTRRLAAKTDLACDPRLLSIFANVPVAWRRGVELRETDALDAPTLAGVWRTQLWMPRAWLARLSDSELRHVLLHELGHARRRDLLAQWLFALATCLHWFNPLVWFAARCARADREMACDAWVLAHSRDIASEDYGATLLKSVTLLRKPLRLAPHVVAMAASKRGLYKRVASLAANYTRPAWRGMLLLLALAGGLAALTTTKLIAQSAAPPAENAPSSNDNTTGATKEASPPASTKPGPLAGRPQVEIAAQFIEVTDSAVRKLAAADEFFGALFNGKVPASGDAIGICTPEQYAKALAVLNGQSGVDVLSTPRVTTRSGQRAVIEIIREFRYPTEFNADDQTPPNFTGTTFETRNTGITFEVEPVAGSDGETIDLNLTPQVVELTGFNRIGPGGSSTVVKVPAGKEADVKAKRGEILQPIFSTRKVTTNAAILNGQTLIIGGLRKQDAIDEKGKPLEPRQLLVFITANIVAGLSPISVAIDATITEHRADGPVVLGHPHLITADGKSTTFGNDEFDATFLARLAGDGTVDVETKLRRFPVGKRTGRQLTPRLKVPLGEPATIRVGDLELGLTVRLEK